MPARRKTTRAKSPAKKKAKAAATARKTRTTPKKTKVPTAAKRAKKKAPPKRSPPAKPAAARTAPAAAPAARSTHLPALPPLIRDTYDWRGTDMLPAWAGLRFYSKFMKRKPKPSDGTVDVVVDRRDDDPSEPNASQLETYAYLKARQQEIAATVLARILAEYPEEKRLYEESVDASWPTLPEIHDVAGLGAVIGPPTIHVWGAVKGGVGEIAFAFDCAWDEEHQLGLLWCDGEITDFGDGNVAGFIIE